jgi:hypothetical protein
MQKALTKSQGTSVLGGRNPFEIVPYAEAVRALNACLTFDDTKYWDNYADAAQAWGKIHHSDEVIRLAKAVKLRAAKRMGELALAMRPKLLNKPVGAGSGRTPGAKSLLTEHMSPSAADAALLLARKPAMAERVLASKNPPSLTGVRLQACANGWTSFSRMGFCQFASITRKTEPKKIAKLAGQYAQDVDAVRRQAEDMSDWLDTFLAALPKPARK